MRSIGSLRCVAWLGVLAIGCGDDSAGATGGSGTGIDGSESTTTTTGVDTSTSTSTSSPGSTDSGTTLVADTSTDPGESSSTGTPNGPPVAVDDVYVTVMDDRPLAIAAAAGVLANDSDPDGDAIRVTDFDAVSARGGTVLLAEDGALTFTPAVGLWGEDGFEYTIDDGNGGTASAHVRVMVAPTTISLDQVSAGGFMIEGFGDQSRAGWSVGGGGDVDGDGRADVLVGAVDADVDGNGEGRGFVVFGKATGETVALADVLDGNGGFAIDGDGDGDEAGYTIAHAGDVNGDGLADVIVGAPSADPIAADEGRAYVVFGKPDGDPITLATLGADGAGFTIEGIGAGDRAGAAVGGGVDVNGDGLDDVIVGAPLANVGGISNAGRVWVVFGKADTDTVLLADVSGGAGGFVINGIATEDQTGDAVAGAGDVNGDGLEDLIVGVPLANPSGGNSGRAFVVFGRTSTTAINLASVVAGSGGFVIDGIAGLDQAGDAVAGAGDLDGDGLCDVILGAPGAEDDLGLQGRSFAVLGKTNTTAVPLLGVVDGTGGFVIEGQLAGDLSGWSVGGGGDLDGDGLADLLVGAQSGDFAGVLSGRSYAIYGRAATVEVPLTDIAAGIGGFAIDGEAAYDVSGWSIANAGDVSADGFADLVIGAYDAPDGDGIGRAYVVFGGDFDASVTALGTPGPDDLTGTDGDDTLVGGDGDDVLHALAGFDVVYGGGGDDIIALGSSNLFRIDGGLGDDTIALDGAGLVLDLPAYYETAIVGIEAVDLTGTGDNTLFLETRDLRALSKTSNTLLVLGDDGDQIVADLTGDGFADLGSLNGFHTYGNGILTLVIADAVEAFVGL